MINISDYTISSSARGTVSKSESGDKTATYTTYYNRSENSGGTETESVDLDNPQGDGPPPRPEQGGDGPPPRPGQEGDGPPPRPEPGQEGYDQARAEAEAETGTDNTYNGTMERIDRGVNDGVDAAEDEISSVFDANKENNRKTNAPRGVIKPNQAANTNNSSSRSRNGVNEYTDAGTGKATVTKPSQNRGDTTTNSNTATNTRQTDVRTGTSKNNNHLSHGGGAESSQTITNVANGNSGGTHYQSQTITNVANGNSGGTHYQSQTITNVANSSSGGTNYASSTSNSNVATPASSPVSKPGAASVAKPNNRASY